MNWILIAVIAVLAIYTYIGWKRGMISVVLSLVAIIATVLITMALTPVVSKSIKENTNLYSNLKQGIYNNIENNSALDDTFGTSEYDDNVVNISQSADEINEKMSQVIDKLQLPASIKDKLEQNNIIDYTTTYVNDSVATIKHTVLDYVAEQLAEVVFQIIIYVVIFIIVYVIMNIVMRALDIVSRLPIIHQANKLAGIVFGAAKGLIIIWTFFAVLTIFSGTAFAQTVFAQVNQNAFVTYIYNNNLIMKLIFSVL